jgi:hypothetical protein
MKTFINVIALASSIFAATADAANFNIECIEESDRTLPYVFAISTQLLVPEALVNGTALESEVLADAPELRIRYSNFHWTFDNQTSGPEQGAMFAEGADAKGIIYGFSDAGADYQYWLDLTLEDVYAFADGRASFNPNFTAIFTETDDSFIDDYPMSCQLISIP